MRGAVESSGSKGPKDKERRQPSSWCFLETRHIVLLLLVVQSTSIVLLMRYSKTRPLESSTSPPYIATAAVLMAELLKLPTCTIVAARTVGVGDLRRLLATELPSQDTLKCAVPAVAFTVQGNLLFIALANLEAPTYQVTYQCKTLFTALFSWLILGRQLKQSQWLALFLLVCGTILVSDPWHGRSKSDNGSASAQSMTTGILAVLAAAILSVKELSRTQTHRQHVHVHVHTCVHVHVHAYVRVHAHVVHTCMWACTARSLSLARPRVPAAVIVIGLLGDDAQANPNPNPNPNRSHRHRSTLR